MAGVHQQAEEKAKIAAEAEQSRRNVITTEEGGWPTYRRTYRSHRRRQRRKEEQPSGPSAERFMLEAEDRDSTAGASLAPDPGTVLGEHSEGRREQDSEEQADMYD